MRVLLPATATVSFTVVACLYAYQAHSLYAWSAILWAFGAGVWLGNLIVKLVE